MSLLASAAPWLWLSVLCLPTQPSVPVMAQGQAYVALTFDDGPRDVTTQALLDGLAQRGVHATFFVIGLRVEEGAALLQRMVAEGHQVGIHSQNHKILAGLTAAQLEVEVGQLKQSLTQLLGETDFMVRPPYGMTDALLLRRLDAPVILWSVDPEDWSDKDAQRQTQHIVSTVKDGDIILLHDIYHSSVDTALAVVDALLAQGILFVTVEELFALRGIEPKAGQVYRCLPP